MSGPLDDSPQPARPRVSDSMAVPFLTQLKGNNSHKSNELDCKPSKSSLKTKSPSTFTKSPRCASRNLGTFTSDCRNSRPATKCLGRSLSFSAKIPLSCIPSRVSQHRKLLPRDTLCSEDNNRGQTSWCVRSRSSPAVRQSFDSHRGRVIYRCVL